MDRRSFLRTAAGATLAAATSTAARAQEAQSFVLVQAKVPGSFLSPFPIFAAGFASLATSGVPNDHCEPETRNSRLETRNFVRRPHRFDCLQTVAIQYCEPPISAQLPTKVIDLF